MAILAVALASGRARRKNSRWPRDRCYKYEIGASGTAKRSETEHVQERPRARGAGPGGRPDRAAARWRCPGRLGLVLVRRVCGRLLDDARHQSRPLPRHLFGVQRFPMDEWLAGVEVRPAA